MSNETKILIGIGVATIALVVGAAFFLTGSPTPEKPLPPADNKVLIKDDSHKMGSESAKVTLVEFGDFQCPACGASHPVVTQLIQEYKDDLRFVFRHFPLSMHANARKAAIAAEAAGKQGKFFEMHDALFENQAEWSEERNPDSLFEKYAQEIGLDVEKFKEDVRKGELEDKVNNDIADGNAAGVNSTPTFFINGIKQAGGLPYDQFKAKIDAELKGNNPQ